MMKRNTRLGWGWLPGWLALLAFALLAMAPEPALARPPDDAPTPAAKASKLAALRAAYRKEVMENGFNSDKAKQLRREIAALEGKESAEPGTGSSGSTGSSGGPADTSEPPPKSEHWVPGIDTVGDYKPGSGVGNPCGAYAVATILQSYGDKVGYQEVFDAIVPIKTGTSPHDIKTYLNGRGHGVMDRNNGSLDDIAAAVERSAQSGERIMMMVNTGSGFEGLHWAAVKGFKIKDGKRFWIFEDTAFGSAKEIPDDELDAMWSNPVPVLGAQAGFNKYYMTVSKDPPGILERVQTALYGLNDRTSAEVLLSGLRDVTRGFSDTFGSGRTVGERVGGFFHMVSGGVLKVVAGGVIGGIVSTAGHYIEAGGDAMMGWGAKKWNEGGFFNKVAGAGATVLGAITKGVGWVISAAGSVISGVLGAIADGISAVGDAIGDGIDAVGDFIGGLF